LYSYDSNLSFGCEIFKFKDFASSLKKIDPRLPPYGRSLDDGKESVVEAFESLIQDTDFTSVIKLSTDLNSQNVKVAWEGKYKDFLVSNGVDLQWKATGPDAKKYGFSIQYSS
jgi:distribution and morphology protein 10